MTQPRPVKPPSVRNVGSLKSPRKLADPTGRVVGKPSIVQVIESKEEVQRSW